MYSLCESHVRRVFYSEQPGGSGDYFKLQNAFLSGIDKKWLNSGLNILKGFLTADVGWKAKLLRPSKCV